MNIVDIADGELVALIDDCKVQLRQIPEVWVKHCCMEVKHCFDVFVRKGALSQTNFIIFNYLPS